MFEEQKRREFNRASFIFINRVYLPQQEEPGFPQLGLVHLWAVGAPFLVARTGAAEHTNATKATCNMSLFIDIPFSLKS